MLLTISLVKINLSLFLRSKRHIIRPGFKAPKGKRIISECYVAKSAYIQSVFELKEDVGLKAGGQIDLAEHSLAGMVALFIVTSLRTKPAKR
jgi:hypothetical protein